MDLKQAARALNTSTEMLLRWARQGAIPAVEENGSYRFDRKSLEAWASRRRMAVQFEPERPRGRTDTGTGRLLAAMQKGGVYFGIAGDDVEGVLGAAVDAIELPPVIDKKVLLDRLLERESLASTGIGHGVAIPHPRHPLPNIPEGGIIANLFLENHIDFNSVDGKRVSVIFIMMSPSTKRHLEMLARLTFCLHDNAFLPNLKACSTAADFLGLVAEVEKKFHPH